MATNIVDRFRTATGPSSRHRKGRSSSECLHKSDGVTPSPSRSPAVRIFHLNDMGSDESPPLQKTPRDQVEDEDSDAPGSMGRAWRRKSVNIGSPLPGAIIQAKSFYDFVGVIGEGKTSQVYYGVHKKTKEKVAIKVIDRRRIISNPDLVAEVSVLKRLEHPNIISLKDVFITPEHLQIVMELCEGHELFDEIVDRRTFSELDARDLIRSILEPLAYLHDQGIAHRDLKPENIMFVRDNDMKHIKLLDFGFAKTVDAAHPDVSIVGTLGYKAPEIFKSEPYTTQCDMWALGVIAYILLCGFPPFFSQEHYKDMVNNAPFWFFFNDETETLVEQIKKGRVSYPDSHWGKLSPQAKEFVQSLLVVDPLKRGTAVDSLKHGWMSLKSTALKCFADLAIKTPTAVLRLRQGGHRRSNSTIFTNSQLESTRNAVERHILADSSTLSFSAEWEQTDVDLNNETLDDVKYRLQASYETQESQLEMLRALDRPALKTYLATRRGSLGSRTARPGGRHQRKASM